MPRWLREGMPTGTGLEESSMTFWSGSEFFGLDGQMVVPVGIQMIPGFESELIEEDGFDFLLLPEGATWEQYLARVARDRDGLDLAPGRVPATMLFAVVGEEIVGRVHIRHELTPALLEEGGHLGYGVRPAHRRRGYATEMLRQGLEVVRTLGVDRALVTCDDDNPGSIGTIERCGGVLEDTRPREGGALTRRYWIDLV